MSLLENAARLLSLVRGVLVLVGLVTVLTMAWPSSREMLLQQFATLAVAAEVEQTAPSSLPAAVAEQAAPAAPSADTALPIAREPAQEAAAAEVTPPREQREVAEFIARRYRVAEEASTLFVRSAYRAGREWSVDPLLILAVMAVESRYNPVAKSSMGALGLMQVIPKFHLEKLAVHGGEQVLLDPEVNIRVGTEILREYMRRFGETQAALQKYAGAFDEPTAQYAGKVMAEKARLEQFLAQSQREV